MDLAALKVELDAGHPVTGVYDADSQTAANQINALNIVRFRATMPGADILNQTDSTELNGLSAAEQTAWLSLCAISQVSPANTGPMVAVASSFTTFTQTISNLQTARDETVSQATAANLGPVKAAYIDSARAL